MKYWLGAIVAFAIVSSGIVAQALTPAEIAAIHEQVGYNQLKAVLGDDLPIGSGVPITQVEAPSNPGAPNPIYFPNTTAGEFQIGSDPSSPPQAVTFNDASGGAANGTSTHATNSVGQFFYGNTTSFAPGANTVTVYETEHWLDNVLNMNGPAPDPHDFRVANFSWIGSFGSETVPDDAANAQALGRFDYLIDNNNITALVGVNKYDNTPPALLSHSLNAIAVGIRTGANPTNPTQSFYYPGRNKPDLISPGVAPSETTAHVSSAATMLHESGAGTDAAKSETMKAILMAGAVKTGLTSWDQTTTEPLDETYGAGEMNIYNSYVIQAGGKYPGSLTQPASPVGIDGWDYRTSLQNAPLYYNFEVPAGSTATELSIILTWNAKVTDGAASGFQPVVKLDNLNLRWYDSSTSFLGTEIVSEASVSTVDNVEHVYLTGLTAGTYTLEVTNLTFGGNRDFGLAWRMETQFTTPSADFNNDGKVNGLDYLAWQGGYRTLTGASHSNGDADGDGDVDDDDLAIFNASFGQPLVSVPTQLTVPEPSTFGLFASGLAVLYFCSRFQ